MRNLRRIIGLMLAIGGLAATTSADEIELRDGRKLVGRVQAETESTIMFQAVHPDGSTAPMTIARSEVRSITLGPLPNQPKPPPKVDPPKTEPPKANPPEQEEPDPSPEVAGGKTTPPTSQPVKAGPRSRAEIDAVVDAAGKTPPDWWGSVRAPAAAGVDLRKLGQYLRGNFDHNPGRHREGVKFLHAVVAGAGNNTPAQAQAMAALGQYYGLLLHDYARGAYWYRRAAQLGKLNPTHAANFAFCYWKLGNNQMAIAEMDGVGYNAQGVRMLGQIGEVGRAVQLARGLPGDWSGLLAGDISRYHGNFKEAAAQYALGASGGRGNSRPRNLCQANVDALRAFEVFDPKRLADGTYRGDGGGGYRGPVQVEVRVKGGRIEDCRVVQTREDWPLNAHVAIPAQIVEKQTIVGIDTVTGATFTSGAVINAAAKALASGVKQ